VTVEEDNAEGVWAPIQINISWEKIGDDELDAIQGVHAIFEGLKLDKGERQRVLDYCSGRNITRLEYQTLGEKATVK
jgi:hypothetical protein